MISLIIKMTSIVQQNLNYNQKNMQNLSNQEIKKLMESERMSLTCAPGGENNRGMEIIGRMPFKGEGFTAWVLILKTRLNWLWINMEPDPSRYWTLMR